MKLFSFGVVKTWEGVKVLDKIDIPSNRDYDNKQQCTVSNLLTGYLRKKENLKLNLFSY